MALISAGNLELAFLSKEVLQGVSFIIEEKNHIGLVGRNGAGKTTLFKLITGDLKPDSGTVAIASGCRVAVMEQQLQNMGRTVYAELESVFAGLMALEAELNAVNAELEKGEGNLDALIRKQQALQERFIAEDGLLYRQRLRATLLGLGFTEAEFEFPVEKLSGGQRSKLSLAKLLLSGADLLLLDEPTNHLDVKAVEWLEDFLSAYKGTFVVISHDRYFLDKVCSSIFELENHKLKIYKGNYSDYLEQKQAAREADLRHNQNLDREIKRLEGVIEQQKRWNREKNLVTAASKAKAVERLRREKVEIERLPEDIRLNFQPKRESGNEVLIAEELALAFGERKLFDKLSMTLKKGEKVFLLGDNGVGKTSLFKILTGELDPNAGNVRHGARVDLGYFDQIQKLLFTEGSVYDEMHREFPHMTESALRATLAAFLFYEDDLQKSCGVLSGGEKARLGLLELVLSGANCLLLDEPTNHLDIAGREALERALDSYEGTILAISHDRYFINRLADRVLEMRDGQIIEYLGGYDYYLEKREERTVENAAEGLAIHKAAEVNKQDSANKLDYQARKAAAAERRKLENAVKKLEERIAQLETEIAELEQRLASPEVATDYVLAMEIGNEKEARETELLAVMEEWEEKAAALD